MDTKEYSQGVINRFRQKKLFFNDPVLKRHYERGDVSKFRARAHRNHKDKSFKDFASVIITDIVRYELYVIIDELTVFLNPVGDLILSGGDAINSHLQPKDRLVTLDIDTKFSPRMKPDSKYFGKLQAVKILLWNKLGELAKRLNSTIPKMINDQKGQAGKCIGFGFGRTGPYVKRRYTLIPKRKFNSKNQKDILIDVEVFALDLKSRLYSPKSGKIEEINMGGMLDIAFMRPGEFGSNVGQTKTQALDIFKITGKYVLGKFDNIKVASKKFLIEDSYTMQKLGLRDASKKEKDRKRMVKLAKLVTKRKINSSSTMENILKKADITHPKKSLPYKNVDMKPALKINPRKYAEFTTTPDKDKLSRQFIYGLKSEQPDVNIPGYHQTRGDQRFHPTKMKWETNTRNSYIKNEFTHRPIEAKTIPTNFKMEETLYGFKKTRDDWVPKPILRKSSMIPYVGLV